MFTSIVDSVTNTLNIQTSLICTAVALVLGIGIALVYMTEGTYSTSYLVTLALLPAMVQTIIILVNGELRTSVAVLGTISLVRFRSVPGSSREISGIFIAVVIGLASGLGYVTYAVIMAVIMCTCMILLTKVGFGRNKGRKKDLRITIPENLDYNNVFQDLFWIYTRKYTLERVKTTNMGSMYELEYSIELRDAKEEKKFIDELRCRNGNLMIVCGRTRTSSGEL